MVNNIKKCMGLEKEYPPAVERAIKTSVDSLYARLSFLFFVDVDVKETDHRVDIYIKVTPKPGVLFCDRSLYESTIKRIPKQLEKYTFTRIIAIESKRFKRAFKDPDILLKNIQHGRFGIRFRTEIEGYVIMNHSTIETKDLLSLNDEYFFNASGVVENEPLETYDGIFRKFKNEVKAKLEKEHGKLISFGNSHLVIGKRHERKPLSHYVYLKERGEVVPELHVIDHINGDITDNHIDNLRILSNSENTTIAIRENKHLKGKKVTVQTKNRVARSLAAYSKKLVLSDGLRPKQKITYSQVKHYRKLYEAGDITKKQIIEETGVNESTVTRFLNYTTFNYG